MEEDLRGAGYNVNQSKIAIGSGALGERFSEWDSNEIEICAGARYRLYLLYHWRGGGLLGSRGCDCSFCYAYIQTYSYRRTAAFCFWKGICLLCGLDIVFSFGGEYRYGHRIVPCYRYTFAFFQLWGVVAVGIYHFVVRFVADRCFAGRKALNLLPLYRSVIPRHATGQVGGEGDT